MGTDAEEFVFAKGFDLRFAGGHHRKRFTQGIEYLQLVARLLTGQSFVIFHNGGNIAPPKILLREIFAESDAGEEREFHDWSGYKVMKRVVPVEFLTWSYSIPSPRQTVYDPSARPVPRLADTFCAAARTVCGDTDSAQQEAGRESSWAWAGDWGKC
jgi:hypothetical protein